MIALGIISLIMAAGSIWLCLCMAAAVKRREDLAKKQFDTMKLIILYRLRALRNGEDINKMIEEEKHDFIVKYGEQAFHQFFLNAFVNGLGDPKR